MVNWGQMKVDFLYWYGINQPTIHRRMKYAACAAVLAGACFCLNHYLHERKVNNITDQVGVLEKMVESSDFNAARPLAESLYSQLSDEADPRLRNLYDDIVLPAYKVLKGASPSTSHRILKAR